MNYRTNVFSVFLISLLMLLIAGCDFLRPEDYEPKEFSISAIDAKAATMFSKEIIFKDSVRGYYVNPDSCIRIRSRVLSLLVDSATRANNTDNQIIASGYSALLDSFATSTRFSSMLRVDSLMGVETDTTLITTYSSLNVAGGGDFYIYTSLEFTGINIDHYVTIDLIKNDSSLAEFTSIVPQEVTHAYTKVVDLGEGQIKVVPLIRSRARYNLANGQYIVRFVKSDASALRAFKLLILPL